MAVWGYDEGKDSPVMKILTFIRSVFSFLLLPLRWLANAFQKKDGLLEWRLNYGSSFVRIDTKGNADLSDDLLIAGYLLFLARYLYICDKRQLEVVVNLLKNLVKDSVKQNEIALKIYEEVFKTLNKMEQNALIGLLRTYSKIFPVPPLLYSEDEEPKHSLARYRFLVFEHGNQRNLASAFYMSRGPDIILLPLTLGILYNYVVDKLGDRNKRENLDRLIIDLLEKHTFAELQSLEGMNRIPAALIHASGLHY